MTPHPWWKAREQDDKEECSAIRCIPSSKGLYVAWSQPIFMTPYSRYVHHFVGKSPLQPLPFSWEESLPSSP